MEQINEAAEQDIALMRRMRKGDADAFAALYRLHEGPLYRFALMRCGDAATAADVVQEVFLALLNGSLQFDALRGQLRSFLFGVARNMLAKRYEASQRMVSSTPADDEIEDDILDPSPAPLEQLLSNEASEKLRAALQKLAAHYRDVLVLYEMHDLSYVEIAEICGIDIGTVRSRLSRARSKLVALLGAQDSRVQAEMAG